VKRTRVGKAAENNQWLEVIIHEGKKRQVRRMLEKVGHPVLKLKRVAVNGLKLGDLKPGGHRPLTREEVERLLEAAGGGNEGLKKIKIPRRTVKDAKK